MASRYAAPIHEHIFLGLDLIVLDNDLVFQSEELTDEDWEFIKQCLLSYKQLCPEGFLNDDSIMLDQVVLDQYVVEVRNFIPQ